MAMSYSIEVAAPKRLTRLSRRAISWRLDEESGRWHSGPDAAVSVLRSWKMNWVQAAPIIASRSGAKRAEQITPRQTSHLIEKPTSNI